MNRRHSTALGSPNDHQDALINPATWISVSFVGRSCPKLIGWSRLILANLARSGRSWDAPAAGSHESCRINLLLRQRRDNNVQARLHGIIVSFHKRVDEPVGRRLMVVPFPSHHPTPALEHLGHSQIITHVYPRVQLLCHANASIYAFSREPCGWHHPLRLLEPLCQGS